MTHSSSLFSHYIWLLLAFRQSFWILCISLTSTQTKWLKKIQTFIVSQSWKLKVQNFGSHTLVLKRSKNLFHGFLLPHRVTLVYLIPILPVVTWPSPCHHTVLLGCQTYQIRGLPFSSRTSS